MTCLLICNVPLIANAIELLIDKSKDLVLVGSCNNTVEAARLFCTYKVDIVFVDIQADETQGYTFVKEIPYETFVIFIAAYYSSEIGVSFSDISFDARNGRFQKGVDMARVYSNILKKDNSNISEGYFVL
ncbi:hypothetical protein ACE38W_16770 [Chitinophaga sp. Hz27]|uniref:hypothetical protein n=1 Tax=Chitinophaga sp. Hz27 TaxID=3347169 RepID=UPI0035D8B658